MKAKDISGQAPGGQRTKLAEIVPLDTPFVVQVFPIYACNFKCNYCIFSIDPEKRGFISDKIIMNMDLYRKFIDELAEFPNKIKVLRFVGIGEPLLHKDIVEMVRYAAEKDVANIIEMLTNGSLLVPEISDELLKAGLTRMVVSLQGTTPEKYKKTSNIDIDFKEFLNNLRYFFENKGEAQMYIKIVDTALDDEEDKKRFYEIFGDLCDTIAIEYTVPIHHGINYDDVLKDDKRVTQFGLPVSEIKVCPQPFFTMQINPDGKIVPCYSFEYPEIVGDCNNETMKDIWNGEKFNKFRREMLEKTKNNCDVCKECSIITYRMFPEDVLDGDAERLKEFF